MNWAEIQTNAAGYRIKLESKSQAERARLVVEGAQAQAKEQRQIQEAGEIFERLHIEELLTVVKDELWKEGYIEAPEDRPRLRHLTSDHYTTLEYGTNAVRLTSEHTGILVSINHRGDNPWISTSLHWFSVPEQVPNVEELIHSKGRAAFRSLSLRKLTILHFDFDVNSPDVFDAICETLDGYKQNMDSGRGYPSQVRSWTEGILKQLPSTLQNPGDVMSVKEQMRWVLDVRSQVPSFLRRPTAAFLSMAYS